MAPALGAAHMIQSMQREAIVETLLNTLEAERYVRGPLLATIADELSTTPGLEAAAEMARAILAGLQSGELVEAEFAARLRGLRALVQGLAAPASGEVLVRDHRDPQDVLGRAVLRTTMGKTTTTASAA